jgi:hypothetical protein
MCEDIVHEIDVIRSRSSRNSTSANEKKEEMRKTGLKIKDPCPICKKGVISGYAHLIGGDFSQLDPSNPLSIRLNANYTALYDVKSHRNFIPMCGSLGEKGTCHDLFDNRKFFVVPTLLVDGNHFTVKSAHPDADALNDTTFELSYSPYRRGLAALAKFAFKKHMHQKRIGLEHEVLVDFSESSSNRQREATGGSSSSSMAARSVSASPSSEEKSD